MPDTPLSLLERLALPEPPVDDWDRLVAVYAPLLRTWLIRYSLQSADVDDLLQDILEVLLEKLPRFRHEGRPGSFRAPLSHPCVGREKIRLLDMPERGEILGGNMLRLLGARD
jgi:RNA polymerase sigma-70 factor (ECF subfamily)